MSPKLRTAVLVAAIAFPVGVLASGLRGHPNLGKARAALSEADRWIEKSQESNEGVWTDAGGHGQAAKIKIAEAKRELDLAAEWIDKHK